MDLRKKHQKTLEAVFARPIRASVKWRDVESLLLALGATVEHGKGSHIKLALRTARGVVPAPKKGGDMDKGALNSVMDFLIAAGVEKP